jgi:short subunit dehydrogenase-like uncharacterized protein
MSKNYDLLLYGAYGYTGRLILEVGKQLGLSMLLAGRQAAQLQQLSATSGYPYEAFGLDQTAVLENCLSKVRVVIHAAGPYKFTAKPMVEACLKTQTHYLDITGEIEVFEWVAAQHERAVAKGIVLLPGAGFDVVPTDCLALKLKKMLPNARQLHLAFKSSGGVSRGTALTVVENLEKGGYIRKEGKLVAVPTAYRVRELTWEGKRYTAVSIPWGDVSTAYHSTGIPNIIAFTVMPPKLIARMRLMNRMGFLLRSALVKKWMGAWVRANVKGPGEKAREQGSTQCWGEAIGPDGNRVHAALTTQEGYSLTAQAVATAALKLLQSPLPPGFYTPALAFGEQFITEVGGRFADAGQFVPD